MIVRRRWTKSVLAVPTYQTGPSTILTSSCAPMAAASRTKARHTVWLVSALVSDREVVETEALPQGRSAQRAELWALLRARELGKDKRADTDIDSRHAFATLQARGALYKERGLVGDKRMRVFLNGYGSPPLEEAWGDFPPEPGGAPRGELGESAGASRRLDPVEFVTSRLSSGGSVPRPSCPLCGAPAAVSPPASGTVSFEPPARLSLQFGRRWFALLSSVL